MPIFAHLTLLMAFLPLLKKGKTRRKFAKESIEVIFKILKKYDVINVEKMTIFAFFTYVGIFHTLNDIFGASNKYKTRRKFAKESIEVFFNI